MKKTSASRRPAASKKPANKAAKKVHGKAAKNVGTTAARPAKRTKKELVKPRASAAESAVASELRAAPLPALAAVPSLAATNVLVWEDDPESESAVPVAVAVPGDPQSRFQINIVGLAPEPKDYAPGTPEFRYWTARAALVRCRDFWEPLLPEDAVWQTGLNLPVTLDAGVQLNAFYHRANGLTFYRDSQDGRDIYTGESADIACHELGHAVLDALQPSLWLALTAETAAFHEAFGDISALLAGLHQDSLCAHVLGRHGGWIERDSRWTRIGEALGKALNRRDPDRASPVCLRNAANGLYYQPPSQLPTSGSDSQLTREPHSLARTFIGAFLQALGGLVRADAATPTVETAQQTAWKAGAWLVAAIRHAPVQIDYFFQVASALTAQAAGAGDSVGRDVIASAFVRRGILPVEALDDSWPLNPKTLDSGGVVAIPAAGVPAGFGIAAGAPPVSSLLDGKRFGLKTGVLHLRERAEKLVPPLPRFFAGGVHRSMAAPLLAAGGGLGAVPGGPPAMSAAIFSSQPLEHEDGFIQYLFQRGRVEFTPETVALASAGPMYARKTHRLGLDQGQLTLERISFDCGFD